MSSVRAFACSVTALTLLSAVSAKKLPEYDAGAAAKTESSAEAAGNAPGLARQERFGAPTVVWGEGAHARRTASSFGGLRAEQAARQHLLEHAAKYGLSAADVASAEVAAVHDTGRGAIVVALGRAVDGIEVFREQSKVVLDRARNLVAILGSVPPARIGRGPSSKASFVLDAAAAAAAALADYRGADGGATPAPLRKAGAAGKFEHFVLDEIAASGLALPEPVRVKKVLFRLADRLEPAYYVELSAGAAGSTEADLYSYVVSAKDGRILFRHDLTVADSFSYRVWADSAGDHIPFDGPQGNSPTPHPTGLPDRYQAPFVAPNLITLQNGPIATNDPWLAPAATTTTGNNVEAYADLASPDGFNSGDLRADLTAAHAFDRTYDTSLAPQVSQNQQKAAVTQLFYDVNFFHDWYYGSGFDEASGNAQTSNFGRGGLDNDSIKAEAQDYGGRNNANMATPSDGARPRMQMYVFDGKPLARVTVNSPASIAGNYFAGTASFGPKVFNLTGAVALVNDGSGTTSDGCQTPFANAAAVNGKIALIDRGNCNFSVKTKNAQVNGAIGVLLANTDSSVPGMSGTDATITIPTLSVSQGDGNTIRGQLGAGVNATLRRDAALDRDGTIDNQIVAHEWGHYISNRLIGDANGLNNNQGGGMGEGWGDFHALLMTVRPEDALQPANAGWTGVYAMAGYTMSGGENNGYYYGIRRVPYSIDFQKNALTFKHIANGTPLPPGVGGDINNNAEVHNTGEVWATMLWECYAALLNDSARLTFDEARDRMRDYLVAAYKITPISPTLLEARDALLAAAYANDPADFQLFAQAFARRGAGLRAVAPERFSNTNQGVVESYVTGGDLALVSATLADDGVSCDADGYLDASETGHLVVTLKNVGNGSLSDTSATITCANPALSFPQGASLTLADSAPLDTIVASVPVQLGAVAGIQALDFTISLSDPGLAFPGDSAPTVSFRANVDDLPNQSATDDVESASPRWTASSSPVVPDELAWQRLAATAYDHRWYGPDVGSAADQYLVSPSLHVAPAGSFSFTLRHRYSFESAGTTYYDGGVVEISTNGGTSWTDIGASVAPGYGGSVTTGGGNPLEGRSAFVATSAGYPSLQTATVNLGTAYQGQDVLVRLRIGTDGGVGGPGWEVDDIAFANVTNVPFNTVVAHRGVCLDGDADGVADASDCAPADSSAFAIPTDARALTLNGRTSTTLAWTAPSSLGGSGLRYDVLRSPVQSSFASATCLESNGTDRTAVDAGMPSSVFFYLVRAENVCGGTAGQDSQGAARVTASCP